MLGRRKTYQKILLLFCAFLAGVSTGAKKTYATARPFARLTNIFSKRYACPPYYRNIYRGYAWPKRTYVRASFSGLCHFPFYHHSGYRSATWPYILCAGFVLAQKSTMQSSQAEDNQYGQPRNQNEIKFFPTYYEFAFLSSHVYKTKEELEKEKANNKSKKEQSKNPTLAKEINGKKETLAGWEIQDIFTDPTYPSYQSVLYIHHDKKQLVLAYQGTNSLKDWTGTNIPSIWGNNAAKGQQVIIEAALNEAIELAKNRDYTLALTGHSLGGWLAQVASFIAHDEHLEKIEYAKRMLKTVVFDAPGAQEMIDKLQHNSEPTKLDQLDITNCVSIPNMVNTLNTHRYTTLYQVIVDDKEFSKILFKHDCDSHQMANFFALFDKDTGAFKSAQAEKIRKMKSWPSQKTDEGDLKWIYDRLCNPQPNEDDLGTFYTRYVTKYAIKEGGYQPYRIHKRHIPPRDYDFLCGKKNEQARYVNILEKETHWAKHLVIDEENKDYVILEKEGEDIKTALIELHSLSIRYPDIVNQKSSSVIDLQKLNFMMAPVAEKLFAGRTTAINTLAPYFEKQDKLVIFPPITGYAGLGKTQLVHKLIAQHAAKYDHIVWVNATTTANIEASYRQIGKELKIVLAPDENTQEVITKVQDRLKDKDVLYVFDNAPDLATIQCYLKNGHILITSKNNAPIDWEPLHYNAPLSLEPFSEEDALHLAKDMGYDTTDQSLLELIQLLPKYPIVMVQLFSNMWARNYTPQTFLNEIKKNGALIEQLKAKPMHYTTYKNSLYYTIESTRRALESREDGEALIHLLQQMACLDDQPIPLSFVLLALGEEEKLTRDLLLILQRHGLLHWDVDYVHMHGFIQTIIGDLQPLTPEQVEKLVDRYVLYNINEVASKSYSTANFWNQIIPHGEKLLDYVKSQRGEDVYTAKCYLNLSWCYIQQDNSQKAMQLGEKGFDLFQKVYGDQPHPDIALSYHNIGGVYHHKGDYDQALQYYQTALEMRKKVYGDQPHPGIAASYNSIGLAYNRQGDYDQALQYYQTALEMRKKVYGDEPHPDIASSYHNIGSVYHYKGDYEKALRYYKTALEMREKVYGDHPPPNIATYYHNIGDVYNSQGNYNQALQFYQIALNMLEKVHGNQPHHHVVTSYNNIGSVYNSQGDYDQALQYKQTALEMLKKVHGNEPHPDVATSYHNIGFAYHSKGDYNQALQYYQMALEMEKKVHGDQPHPDIATSYNNIGGVYYSQESYDQALQFFQMALEMRKKVYDDQPHADIASAYHNIGNVYDSQGDYDQALQFSQMALDMRKKVYGDQPHPDIASSYNNIGGVYLHKRDYDQALQFFQTSLEMLKKVHGDQPHPHIATCYGNMVSPYLCKWDIMQGISSYANASRYRKKM